MNNHDKKQQQQTVTLQEYIKELQKMNRKHKNLVVVYSCDDEGNSYDTVVYSPSVGSHRDRQFHAYNPDDPENECDKDDINAVCLNWNTFYHFIFKNLRLIKTY